MNRIKIFGAAVAAVVLSSMFIVSLKSFAAGGDKQEAAEKVEAVESTDYVQGANDLLDQLRQQYPDFTIDMSIHGTSLRGTIRNAGPLSGEYIEIPMTEIFQRINTQPGDYKRVIDMYNSL